MPRHLTAVLVLGGLAACSSGSTSPQSSPALMEEVRIVPRRTGSGEFEFESYDAEQLFTRGTTLLKRGKCQAAVRYYDHLTLNFVASHYVAPALYNAGLCLQQTKAYAEAANRFKELLERFPGSPDAKHANFHLVSLELQLHSYDAALGRADDLLSKHILSTEERIEVMAARARALYGLQRFTEAERQALGVLQYVESSPQQSELAHMDAVAAANFLLAEVLQSRAALVSLQAKTRQEQHHALERRTNLTLEAQREYLATIRRASPYWAVAAGYQIGRMYEAMWTELAAASVPDDIAPEAHEAYRSELRELIRPLVQHAIRYWELTLRMVERMGVRSEWTERVRRDLERVRQRIMGLYLEPEAEASPGVAPGTLQ